MAKRHTNWVITPDKYFRADEIEKIYESLSLRQKTSARRHYINLFLVDMLLGTGLRASELCNLRVEQTPVVLGVDKIWVKGKGNKTRIIAIRPELSEIIHDYVENIRPSLLPRKIKRRDYTAPLLFTEYSNPFNRKLLYSRLRRIGIWAGILKNVGPHRFRHTYATTLYQQTHDILAVQSQLGHSDVSTTAVYAKTDSDRIVGMLGNISTLRVRTTLSNLRRVKPLKDRILKQG
jgi:site-specific recombinase XerD